MKDQRSGGKVATKIVGFGFETDTFNARTRGKVLVNQPVKILPRMDTVPVKGHLLSMYVPAEYTIKRCF